MTAQQLIPTILKRFIVCILFIGAVCSMTMSRTISKELLLQKGASFRSSLFQASSQLSLPSEKELFYDSAFQQRNSKGDTTLRGFSNWLIPNKVMIGQYPAQTPEANGASHAEAKRHIYSLIHKANIRTFCSLQSEIPSQVDREEWTKAGGKIFLEKNEQKDFPHFFSHYEPLVQNSLNQQFKSVQRFLSSTA